MLDIEIVTPETAQAWIDAGIHRRYHESGMDKSFWRKESFRNFKLEHGQRLLVALGTEKGEVLDGALALHAIVHFGQPVECAVIRVPNFESHNMKEWETLPDGWLFLKMPREERPQFARNLKDEGSTSKATMFILFQINHTTGVGGHGPVSRSVGPLLRHLQSAEGIDWTEGGSHWFRDNTPEEDTWEWFSGVSNGGRTTHTAFIRPIEELEGHSD